ncbi:MAG: hypothetical protein U5K37_05295 [Natrialbaceae archaeon]|nr:hypothetical protein [Natrialbaceae archaeon]
MATHPSLNTKVNQALEAGGLHYEPGSVRVRHLLDLIYTDIGEEAIPGQGRPVAGRAVRIAPYYGCQVVRPTDRF